MHTNGSEKLEYPRLPGLYFRGYQGEQDLPRMLVCINGSKHADNEERSDTLEELKYNYAHLKNCDPDKDVLLVEANGSVVAYSRTWWNKTSKGERIYMFFWYIMPEWRDAGVGEAILDYQERRIHQIAAGHPKEEKAYIQLISDEKKEHTNRLLETAGFKIVRYTYLMIRPIDDPLPDAPMPPGLDVRPVETGHYRKIWNSAHEAFNDHWGHAEPTEQDYQNWMANKYFQPELWKVAWDGDEAVGMVRNYILGVENAEYHRLRGYTEGISVRRPWRKMGIARSLLVQSIRMFKDMGMQETALRVDAENPTGALNLYAGVGYQVVRTEYTYRKAVLEAVTAGD